MKIPELRSSFSHRLNFYFWWFSFFSGQRDRDPWPHNTCRTESLHLRISFIWIFLMIYIFNNSSTAPGCFKSQTNICSYESTILNINISCATTHFTADYKSTMRMVNCTITHYYILCRHSSFSSFCISTGFNTDAIISYIKYTVFNQYIFAGFKIKSITILCIPGIFYSDIAYGYDPRSSMDAGTRRVSFEK